MTFHYSEINQGNNNTSADAFILTVDGDLEQQYLSYWGGGRFEMPLGFRLLGEDYIIFGGESTSVSSAGPTIPLGTLSVNSYFQDDVNDNYSDAFISQVPLPEYVGCIVHTDDRPGNQQGFLVYPNPTAGTVFIKSSSFSQHHRFSLFDGLGRRLFARSISKTTEGLITIDLRGYAPGAYFLHLESSGLSQGFTIFKH